MTVDIHAKSLQLLELIANSVHERDNQKTYLLCFSTSEVKVVEQWIGEFVDELKE